MRKLRKGQAVLNRRAFLSRTMQSAAAVAGSGLIQENTMAFNPDHAKRMRKAFQGSGRVVQIGMQMNSGPGIRQVMG